MKTVAIFDSGVGGLSVYMETVRRSPEHNYLFVSDNYAFPYGTKSTSDLSDRVTQVVAQIVAQYSPDLIVVACNTASTVMLPALRARHELEIVGVVPAIKPAALLSETKTIGLLATPATIERDYTNDLIREFAGDCHVVRVGSSELVEMAEQKLRGKTLDMLKLESILAPFFNNKKVDVLVLACTHFPLLINEIENLYKLKKRSVTIVDSGVAIARRVVELLEDEEAGTRHHLAANKSDIKPVSRAVFTLKIDDVELIKQLSLFGLNDIKTLSVD